MPSASGWKSASTVAICASTSGVSPVNVQSSPVWLYGRRLLTAVSPLKQNSRRLMSLAAPVVTASDTSEPSAIASEAATVSSVSMGLTRVAVCAATLLTGPRI
jgi:hypothetical protein